MKTEKRSPLENSADIASEQDLEYQKDAQDHFNEVCKDWRVVGEGLRPVPASPERAMGYLFITGMDLYGSEEETKRQILKNCQWTPDWKEFLRQKKGELDASQIALTKINGDSYEMTFEADGVDEQSSLLLTPASDIAATPPEFLLRPYFPKGSLTLLVGDPGTGKSFVAQSISAHLTTGREILGVKLKPMKVFFLSNEDTPGISRWRFERAGADLKRIMLETFSGELFTLRQADVLESAVKKHRPGFVVIDSMMSHLGGEVDSYRPNEVGAVMAPLAGIAEKYGTGILGLMHMRKADSNRILYRVQGSIGFAAGARSVLALDYDPTNPDTGRILVHIKSNNSPLGPSQSLTISDAVVYWNGESQLKAGDLFGNEPSGDEKSAMREAEQFLREMLLDGEMPSEEVTQEAKSQGIAERTLKRARKALGVESKKSQDGKWIMVPPEKWPKGAKK
jgi:Mrp family chromosome partitioning ATPase